MIVKSANHKRIVNVPKSYLWRRMSDFKNVGSLLPPPIIDEVKCESNGAPLIWNAACNALSKKGQRAKTISIRMDRGFSQDTVTGSAEPSRNGITSSSNKAKITSFFYFLVELQNDK